MHLSFNFLNSFSIIFNQFIASNTGVIQYLPSPPADLQECSQSFGCWQSWLSGGYLRGFLQGWSTQTYNEGVENQANVLLKLNLSLGFLDTDLEGLSTEGKASQLWFTRNRKTSLLTMFHMFRYFTLSIQVGQKALQRCMFVYIVTTLFVMMYCLAQIKLHLKLRF